MKGKGPMLYPHTAALDRHVRRSIRARARARGIRERMTGFEMRQHTVDTVTGSARAVLSHWAVLNDVDRVMEDAR